MGTNPCADLPQNMADQADRAFQLSTFLKSCGFAVQTPSTAVPEPEQSKTAVLNTLASEHSRRS